MGKEKSIHVLRSPAVPHRQRSNQDDERDGYCNNDNNGSSTTERKTMQCSTSAFAPLHEAATLHVSSSDATAALGRSKSVTVLRRCEDLKIRTGGFQKIEEAAHRLDIRRPRHQQQHLQESSARDRLPKEAGLRKVN
ncbi:hypothetical protein PC129_g2822 [Phytophthora cactorum]|uniref:Uncharacterized protein n=1 Tax=Phytophthora cactorum TaxID=29920 RepID=A0A329SFR1_9STRA|nr:hypothetical protein PC112_g5998 [Phytophthora cactorum]KAG2837005.1 hypothetical protein PC111_g4787 [Phytophthora cactorum]KAG2862851.1 hypothetical protein PC113_g5935 [Phytophthora cactorum]KAG2919894.1 hypothetical protein PC114_g6267 [Phytophthora cactorum]KAG2934909.1 hypothetical protein PC115_g5006 [Phytophthora cactorum]